MVRTSGNVDQVPPTGIVIYGDDGEHSYAAKADSAGNLYIIGVLAAGTAAIGNVTLLASTASIGKVTLLAGTAAVGQVNAILLAGTAAIGTVGVTTIPALVAGTANIGDVDVATLPALVAGTANIGDVDIATIAAGTATIGKVRIATTAGNECTNDTYDSVKTHRTAAGLSNSGVKTADASIKGSAGDLYWLTVSTTAAGTSLFELNDSTDNSGTDAFQMALPASAYAHMIFDPPIAFTAGIYLDVSSAGTIYVVGGYI